MIRTNDYWRKSAKCVKLKLDIGLNVFFSEKMKMISEKLKRNDC